MLKQVEEAIGVCKKLAPTHAAAKLNQGMTIRTFVARQAAPFQGTIPIDGISMVPLPLPAALNQLRADGNVESYALVISVSCLQWATHGEAQQSIPQSFTTADFPNVCAILLRLLYDDAGDATLCILTST